MEKGDLVEGLKQAVERGETLEQAMKSFANAGYNLQDIEDSARVFQGEGIFSFSESSENLLADINTKEQKSELNSSGNIEKIIPKNQSPIQTQNKNQIKPLPQFSKKKEEIQNQKPKKGKKLIVFMIIILLILLGVLGVLFFAKEWAFDLLEKFI